MAALAQVTSWARRLKRDVLALWIAARSSRTPLAAKAVAGVVAAYALSPIDLIPDFIPVLGYLDDLLIVPLGITLAIRLIPTERMAVFRAAAVSMIRPSCHRVAILVVCFWVIGCFLGATWVWRRFTHL